ncbi:MAG: hypothetical protein HGA98_05880 [Deltaproteobacteria bacterium]|nr:hypothetical protein [Deltaproteobacteria bacterium]
MTKRERSRVASIALIVLSGLMLVLDFTSRTSSAFFFYLHCGGLVMGALYLVMSYRGRGAAAGAEVAPPSAAGPPAAGPEAGSPGARRTLPLRVYALSCAGGLAVALLGMRFVDAVAARITLPSIGSSLVCMVLVGVVLRRRGYLT